MSAPVEHMAGYSFYKKLRLLRTLASLKPGTKVVLIDQKTLEERPLTIEEPLLNVKEPQPKQVGAVIPRGTGASFFTRDTLKQGMKQTW
jgi:hypothetical protein